MIPRVCLGPGKHTKGGIRVGVLMNADAVTSRSLTLHSDVAERELAGFSPVGLRFTRGWW